MKKILLIIIIFLLTGCYDYIEVNDLGFISSISIDYQEENYLIGFELLNTNKEEQAKTTIIKTEGQTISNAFDNIHLKLEKAPYYHHLKVVIISQEVAKNHLKEITDYFVRSSEIRNEFYLVIYDDNNLMEIIEQQSKNNINIGQNITKLIDSKNNQFNIAYNKSFEDILEKLLNNKIEATASVIHFNDNEIVLKGIGLFKGYQYQDYLDSKTSAVLNILTNNNTNYLIEKNDNNELLSIKLSNFKVDYQCNDHNVKIIVSSKGRILENNSNLNLKDNDAYVQIENYVKEQLEKDIYDLLDILKKDNIDAIGLNNLQLKKSKKDDSNYLKNANITVNVDVKINQKGTIFKITNE